MKSDFVSDSVAYGLQQNEFEHLPSRIKKKLVRLMARISEASYRRGLQQGSIGIATYIDPAKLRYGVSLDKSPDADQPSGYSSVDRLEIEFGVLMDVGFEFGSHQGIRRMAR